METDQSSAYSMRYVAARRTQELSFGKIPTTPVRLRISRFNLARVQQCIIFQAIFKALNRFRKALGIGVEHIICPFSCRFCCGRQPDDTLQCHIFQVSTPVAKLGFTSYNRGIKTYIQNLRCQNRSAQFKIRLCAPVYLSDADIKIYSSIITHRRPACAQ